MKKGGLAKKTKLAIIATGMMAFLFAVTNFIVGTFLCGAAPDFFLLIIGRLLQAIANVLYYFNEDSFMQAGFVYGADQHDYCIDSLALPIKKLGEADSGS